MSTRFLPPLCLSLALCPLAPAQSPPPLAASYQWSLSGKQYVLASTPVERLPYGLSLDLVTGWEAKDTKALVWGPGVSYTREFGRGFVGYIGASLLLGPVKPDVGLGVGLGFRF